MTVANVAPVLISSQPAIGLNGGESATGPTVATVNEPQDKTLDDLFSGVATASPIRQRESLGDRLIGWFCASVRPQVRSFYGLKLLGSRDPRHTADFIGPARVGFNRRRHRLAAWLSVSPQLRRMA